MHSQALSTLETIVADFGNNLSPNRPQSPVLATVAEFSDSRRFCRQSPNSTIIVASMDMAYFCLCRLYTDFNCRGR